MAAVELKLPRDVSRPAVVKYLGDNVKTFEDIRIAAAAFEAVGRVAGQADAWLEQIAKLRNADGTYGKGDGAARDTGGAVAAVLRLGGKVEHPEAVLKAMKAGQRKTAASARRTRQPRTWRRAIASCARFTCSRRKPDDAGRLRAFVDSCRNDDGGYGVARANRRSASGTYYAATITPLARREVTCAASG